MVNAANLRNHSFVTENRPLSLVQYEAVRRLEDHLARRVFTPPNAPQMTLEDFGWPKSCAHGDDCCLPECAPRPSPAENAKRYTREDGTW